VNLDRESYPENFQCVTGEIARRKALGQWKPTLMVAREIEFVEENEKDFVVIRAEKNPAAVFLAFWLIPWLFFECFFLVHFISNASEIWSRRDLAWFDEGVLFFLGWSIGGAFAAFCLIWMIWGQEIIGISVRGIEFFWAIPGIKVRSEFVPMTKVRGLRTGRVWYPHGRWGRRLSRVLQIVTADKAVAFGKDIDLEEAEKVMAQISAAMAKRGGFQLTIMESFNES